MKPHLLEVLCQKRINCLFRREEGFRRRHCRRPRPDVELYPEGNNKVVEAAPENGPPCPESAAQRAADLTRAKRFSLGRGRANRGQHSRKRRQPRLTTGGWSRTSCTNTL